MCKKNIYISEPVDWDIYFEGGLGKYELVNWQEVYEREKNNLGLTYVKSCHGLPKGKKGQ